MAAPTVGRLHLLTAREFEVLQCLVDGLGPTQLATHLYISPNTSRTHIKTIRQKLGVHSMLEIVSLAVSEGMRPRRTPPR